MANCRCDGKDLVSILIFLAPFIGEANNNGISNGISKFFLAYFLSCNGLFAYKSLLYLDAVDDTSVVIKSCLEAIQGLLRSYAKNEFMRDLTMESAMELAMSHGHTLRLTGPTQIRLKSQSYLAKTMLISLKGTTIKTDTARSGLPHGNGALMHSRADTRDGPPPHPRCIGSTTEANAASTEESLGQSTLAPAIFFNYTPRLGIWTQPERVIWAGGIRAAEYPFSDKRAAGGGCYLCVDRSPCIGLPVGNSTHSITSLTEDHRGPPEPLAPLPTMTYYIMGLTAPRRDYAISRSRACSGTPLHVPVKKNDEPQAPGN